MTYPSFFFSILFLLLAAVHASDIQRRATGDNKCGLSVCVAATVNGSTTSYVLSSVDGADVGWMAIGFGTAMANTPMVIMWMNGNGTPTLSQRKAPSEVMPTVDAKPPRIASFSSELSVLSSSNPSLAFTIPSNNDTKQALIYALGNSRPTSSSVSATLFQHSDYGVIQLDLTKTLVSTSTLPTPTGTATSSPGRVSIPLRPYQKMIIAHAIFCTVGFLLVLPAGALLARYLRTFRPWFKAHATLQFFIAGPTIFIGVMLGIAAVSKARAVHLDSLHKRWGIAIFVLYLMQVMLGAFIHFKHSASGRRPPQNYLHAVVGLLIIALALYQVRTGYNVEWPTTTGRDPLPAGVDILYWVWVVLLPVSYGVGLVFLPKQYKKERAERKRNHNEYSMK